MSVRHFLLVGGAGQVGSALRRIDWPSGTEIASPSREALDICDAHAIAEAVGSRPWTAIINCAAFTAVDQAETAIEEAWRINALGPAILAGESGRRGIPLIHISTDYVFDGEKDTPYLEDDPVRPLGVYGASKEGGEQAVRTANPRHVILRTAWVYGPDRTNFVKTMLRLANEKTHLRIVDDQRGSPTAADDLACAIRRIALDLPPDGADRHGTFHLAGTGDTTWHDFAQKIFALAGPRLPRAPAVEPIATEAYPTPARRPRNSRLNCDAAERAFGVRLPGWEESLARTLDALLGPAATDRLA